LLETAASWCLLLTQLILASAQVNAQWRHQLLHASSATPHQAPAAAVGNAGLHHIHCTTRLLLLLPPSTVYCKLQLKQRCCIHQSSTSALVGGTPVTAGAHGVPFKPLV
jgi:hypothetical protein